MYLDNVNPKENFSKVTRLIPSILYRILSSIDNFYSSSHFQTFKSRGNGSNNITLGSTWIERKRRWKKKDFLKEEKSFANCYFEDEKEKDIRIELLLDLSQKSKRKIVWVKPGEPGSSQPKQYILWINCAKVVRCIWWDMKGVVYYELLKLNETIDNKIRY